MSPFSNVAVAAVESSLSSLNLSANLFSLVAHSAPTPPEDSQWHLFNDFLVKPVSPKEALTFNTTWKTPLIVLYQLKVANNQIDSTWKQNLDASVLYQDQTLVPQYPLSLLRLLLLLPS